MDREGIYAARSVTAIGADGEGKAGGSNAQKPPPGPESLDVQPDDGKFQSSAGPESLNVEPARSPVPASALPARELHEPADQPAQISILKRAGATKPLSPEIEAARAAARAERRDPAYEADRDDGSRLPEREDLRRPGPLPAVRQQQPVRQAVT
jgi:hypothetical protein